MPKEICPVCGSREIVCLDRTANKYRCKSCDEVFEPEDKAQRIVSQRAMAADKVFTPAEIYKSAIDSVFELSCLFGEDSTDGTGFYISADGYIITNRHVVIDRLPNGKYALCDEVYACKSKSVDYSEAEVVYVDSQNDLALLHESVGSPVKPLKLADRSSEIGESVVVIGNSKGEGLAVVNGIVSDVEREFNGHPAFLFNALVAHGCSGGPVFNNYGEVCGVTVGGRLDAEGMKYGIPVEVLREFIKAAELETGVKIVLP